MHPVNYPSASQLGGFFLPNAVSVHIRVWSIQEARKHGSGVQGGVSDGACTPPETRRPSYDQKKGFQASLFKGNYQKNVGFQAGSFQGGANPKSKIQNRVTGLDTHVPMQLHTGGKGLFPPLRSTLPSCLFGQSRFPSPLLTCYFKAWYGQLRFRNPHLSPIQYAQTELIGHYLLSRLSNGLLGRE